jgi:DNA-binding beta-propeller fold protein YncE
MRAKALISLLAIGLAACGRLGSAGPGSALGEALILGSDGGVVSMNPGTGAVRFQGPGVPALGNWSTLFETAPVGDATTLQARDVATGDVVSSVQLPGSLDVRVASPEGSRVAMMAPLPAGGSPWIPNPRTSTDLVVVDWTGATKPRTYRLDGNLEPEAFSFDGSGLFLISYVPPADPTGYRVARLDLASGKVASVSTGVKGVVETMSGTRLEQVVSPDGTMLYTLYTTQPAEYAELRHHAGRPVAFVHTLSLDEGWAHCVGLPRELWGGDPTDQAMAVSPDGARLYVVDTARDVLAVMDTEKLTSESFELGLPSANTPTRAAVGEDGTLFVAAGTEMVAIDPATPEITATWATGAAVTVLGTLPDGLGVAMADRITVIEPATGKHLRTIPSPTVEDPAYLGLLSR